MLLKDETTSKSIQEQAPSRPESSLLATRNPALILSCYRAALLSCYPTAPATKGGAASLQNAPFATPKHHATEGRNDLQINRKSKFPGGRNVPSEILLEILSYPILLSC